MNQKLDYYQYQNNDKFISSNLDKQYQLVQTQQEMKQFLININEIKNI